MTDRSSPRNVTPSRPDRGTQVARSLLAAGAPWNALDRRGRCAGDLALDAGHSEAAEAILEAGAASARLPTHPTSSCYSAVSLEIVREGHACMHAWKCCVARCGSRYKKPLSRVLAPSRCIWQQ